MRTFRRIARVGAGLAALALVAAACGSDRLDDQGATSPGLTGSIVVSGSSTVEPISSAVAEFFNADNPDVEVDGERSRDRRRLRALLRRRDRHQRRVASDRRGRGGRGVRGGRHRRTPSSRWGSTALTVIGNPANPSPVSTSATSTPSSAPSPRDRHLGRRRTRWRRRSAATVASPTGARHRRPGRGVGDVRRVHRASGSDDIAEAQGVPEDDWTTLRNGLQPLAERQRDRRRRWRARRRTRVRGLRLRAERRARPSRSSRSTAARAAWRRRAETVIDGSYPLSRSLYIYVSDAAMTRTRGRRPSWICTSATRV